MYQKIRGLLLAILIIGTMVLSSQVALAQGCNGNPNDVLGLDCGQETGLTREDPRVLTMRIINFALSFLGLVAFVLILYAGFTWMTAGGNDEKIGTAKKILISAIIGLTIIMVSYAITNYVIRALCATTGSCGTQLW